MLLATPFVLQADSVAPEQVAFNYFAEHLVSANYSGYNKLYFSGQSESAFRTSGSFKQCSGPNYLGKDDVRYKAGSLQKVIIDHAAFTTIKKSAKPRRRKLYVQVFRTVREAGFLYTYILVYQVDSHVDHYLIKMTATDRVVVDVCRGAETI